MITPERQSEILETVPEIIISREKIPNSNDFRITKFAYFAEDGVLFEDIIYKYPANSGYWRAELSRNVYEPSIGNIPTYREISIQDHPTLDGVTRTINLADLQVTKDAVRTTSIIKHSNEIPDILLIMYGDNTSVINVNGVDMGERDYWEYLTEEGYDPYTLWDQRMIELDNQGRFNNIY